MSKEKAMLFQLFFLGFLTHCHNIAMDGVKCAAAMWRRAPPRRGNATIRSAARWRLLCLPLQCGSHLATHQAASRV
jgi:hypothetical protein